MATDLNHSVLIGRLTRDLGSSGYDFGYVGNGTAKGILTIAVNKNVKINGNWTEETSFFDVEIWGKLAETLKPYLTKGTQIAVEGHLTQSRWEKDGKKYSKIVITADSLQLLSSKKTSENQSENEGFAPINNAYTQAYSSNFNTENPPENQEEIIF
ncbi:MAG: single-stranded DNA-binding protein [Spirochaetia bacterium]|nr:single-stranded DNA-binding protein [Spirochaetia bacterium]